ncbi:MAG TPA: FAD:protein FMN transferase [Gaiellales bacterium]|nr:FAD:protein FMN transferase [Gaiellales bacterium]
MIALDTTVTPLLWEWHATGSIWRIYHSGGVDARVSRVAAAEVEADEARWSRFRPDSDVSRINRGAGHPVAVDRSTLNLVDAACRWRERTGGVFQPLAGRLLEAWGYGSSFTPQSAGAPLSPETGARLMGRPRVDRERGTVTVPAGSMLDLGGIAKSWIARRLAETLRACCDDTRMLVDAGGDLVSVRGEHLIAVDDSSQTDLPIGHAALADGWGAATSGWGRRHWTNGDGRAAHHLIDPHTGEPGGRTHATVFAADPVAADVLATVLALRPQDAARRPEPCRARLDAHVWTSPAWREVAR